MDDARPAVEVEALSRRYGDRPALDGVSLRVDRGELFALLGPNGGGKTTLLRILCTLLPPSAGAARIFGRDVAREADAVRRRIGVVFQSPSLDRKLTVAENLRHHGHLYGLRGAPLRGRIGTVLDRFGIADRAAERVERLSGGLARRVEAAKALLPAPDLLLLDEPTTGLDVGARAELGEALREARDRDGVTVLLSTHLLNDAQRFDRLAILDHGRVVAFGAPDTLRGEIGGDVVAVTTREPDALAAEIRARFAVEPRVVEGTVRIERPRGHEFVPALVEAFPGRIDAVTVSKPTLEDVFIRATGRRMEDGA